MIITIDKTKELTRKEYIDFRLKTKGETLSESRISQLVSAGKLAVRDYPELNNLQLILLDDEEQSLAQARFTTTQALHTYTYKELGLMVSKLIHDLTNENGNAKTLQAEQQAQLEQLVATLGTTEQERNEAQQRAVALQQQLDELTAVLTRVQQTLAIRDEQLASLRLELTTMNELLTETQRKLTAESSFRSEFESFKELVMGVLVQTKSAADEALPKKSSSKRRTSDSTKLPE